MFFNKVLSGWKGSLLVCGSALFASTIVFCGCSPKVETLPDWSSDPIDGLSTQQKLNITYPLDEAMFPPEIIAPTFAWSDESKLVDRWVGGVDIGTNAHRFLCPQPTWRPDAEVWKQMKAISVDAPLSVSVIGYNSQSAGTPVSKGSVRICTSQDEVGAPIFYREVILPFIDAVIDPSKLRWRYGSVDMEEQPPIVLEGLPVCGNCHSFSADGSILAMDVDYANSKGSYVITRIQEEMNLNTSDVITWNDFRKEDREQTFGLLSQISPDGRYVLSTVKDKSVFVPMEDLYYSQLFFPLKGIVAWYDRVEEKFGALGGADDPKYVQSNPTWSPDGKTVLFARTETYDLKNTQGAGKTLLTREECKEFVEDGKPFQFKLYQVPFNEGKGGTPVPLEGASEDGVSSYFPKYSPDGRWIVFCKSSSYMLLRGDSRLYIMPASGGEPRLMRCNTANMNSWHSWSPNGKWLVFSSKINGPYTQLWLTHIDVNGESTPPVVLHQFTAPDRAANIPEFVNNKPGAIKKIEPHFLNDISWCRAGDEFFRNNKPQEALTNYLGALALNPNCYQAHQKIGFLYFNVMNRPEEGVEHMKKAIELEPLYAMSQYDYGMANLSLKNFDLAKKHILRAIQLVPRGIDKQYDAGDMRYQLARATFFGGDIDEAIGILEKTIEFRPNHAESLYFLASLLASRGDDMAQVIALMRKAISINPKVDRFPDLHEKAGIYFAELQDYNQSLMEAERALAMARQQNKTDMILRLEDAIAQLRQLTR